MDFPDGSTFQYMFFSTYIGYFLQALPIAWFICTAYGIIRYKGDTSTPLWRKVFSCAFVGYITGLLCLVVGLDLMGIGWYRLLYQTDPGRTVRWFAGEFDFIPDFFYSINGEAIGNLLLFMPFGILYPLSVKKSTWKNTVLIGFVFVLLIEFLQPIFGRAFDLNDVLLNAAGIVISTGFFGVGSYFARKMVRKDQ